MMDLDFIEVADAIGIPELKDILPILQHAEELESKSRNLKRRAEELRQPECFKKPYNWHPKNIEAKVEKLPDERFRRIFGMTKYSFEILNEKLHMHFPKLGLSPNKQGLLPRERLYIFLYHLRGDSKKEHGSWQFDCSPALYWESVDMCIEVVHQFLCPEYIRLPTPDEARRSSLLFRERSGYRPNGYAAYDGCHIKVS